MKHVRAWTRLPSGARLDLINPAPNAWTDADLAIRLSRTFRWGGEGSWPHPLSVAQHSLMVLALRQEWSRLPLDPSAAMYELLHDAEEGFLGFDCISPLKAVLGEPFKIVSDHLSAAIAFRYNLPTLTGEEKFLHKQADLIVASSEAVFCAGWSIEEARAVLEITHPMLDHDPLASIYGTRAWEPWAPAIAAARFLEKLVDLQNLRAINFAEAG